MSYFALAAAILLAGRVWGEPPEPTTSPAAPEVPVLVAGAGEPRSFVVRGIARPPAGGRLGFYFATDGERQRSAIYDVRDGVPIFLSDGRQTLIYDFQRERVVVLPSSRGYLRVDWEPDHESPIAFEFGVHGHPRLEVPNSTFRVDRFVADKGAALRLDERTPESCRYVAESPTSEQTLEVPNDATTEFRFQSRVAGSDAPALDMKAERIGEAITADLVTFPDLQRLRADVEIFEPGGEGLRRFTQFVRDGRAWAVKMALVMGPTLQKELSAVLGNPDWEELAAKDAEFGTKYRRALAAQGIEFPRK